jgi:hypothetical protein
MASHISRLSAPLFATSLAAALAACGGAPSQPAGPAPVVVTTPPPAAADGTGSPALAAPKVTAPGPNVTPDGVVFNYRTEPGNKTIYLAASFNEWNKENPQFLMKDDDGDGTWTITVKLPPGTYQYKYVADGKWTQDTYAPSETPDGFGGRNSQFEVK